MGHNAWTNYVVGTRWNIIFDIKPQQGSRMLMDGLPGHHHQRRRFRGQRGGNHGHRDDHHPVRGLGPEGKPEFSRARKALQYSRSIDDFVRIMLDGNNGGYANDWLVGDRKTGEIALFELGLKNHSVQRTRDGCFFGANFPVDPKLTREETKFDPNKKDSSPNARKVRWEQLMAKHKGAIDVELGKAFETDDFDVIDQKHEANERTLCGRVEITPRGVPEWDWKPYYPGGTVQSKVIDRMAGKHGILGPGRPPRVGLPGRAIPQTTPRVRLDARPLAGHEERPVVPVRGRYEVAVNARTASKHPARTVERGPDKGTAILSKNEIGLVGLGASKSVAVRVANECPTTDQKAAIPAGSRV